MPQLQCLNRTPRTEESLTLSTSDDFTIRFDKRDLFFDIIFYPRVSAIPKRLKLVSCLYVYNTQLTAGGSPDATFDNNSTSQDNSHGKSFVFRIRINTHKDIVRSIERFRTLLHVSVFIAKRHSAWP